MTTQNSQTVKRRYRRKTVRILVDYTVDENGHCDYATTLGAGGMFLESPVPLPTGTLMNVKFKLPGSDHSFEIPARVAWNDETIRSGEDGTPKGMGIEFLDIVACTELARELEKL